MNDNQPTVFIIDDDQQVCQAIGLLMESVNLRVASFSCVQDYLSEFDEKQLGCLIVDVRMPQMSGLDLQQYFIDNTNEWHPPMIIISGHGDISMAVKAVQMGALDFIEKPFNNQQMIDTVHRGIALDKNQRDKFEYTKLIKSYYRQLTKREVQVFQSVTAGKPNKIIAGELFITQSTVEAHRAKVMEKMSAKNLSELIKMAVLLGLIKI